MGKLRRLSPSDGVLTFADAEGGASSVGRSAPTLKCQSDFVSIRQPGGVYSVGGGAPPPTNEWEFSVLRLETCYVHIGFVGFVWAANLSCRFVWAFVFRGSPPVICGSR